MIANPFLIFFPFIQHLFLSTMGQGTFTPTAVSRRFADGLAVRPAVAFINNIIRGKLKMSKGGGGGYINMMSVSIHIS
jgi:hypothetical protein